MDDAHGMLATTSLVLAVACLGAAVVAWLWARPIPVPVLLDRVLLLQAAVLGLALVTGVWVALTSGSPRDPLHLAYGAAVLVPLPVARYIARTGTPRRRAAYLALGALTTVGLVMRLFQTGG